MNSSMWQLTLLKADATFDITKSTAGSAVIRIEAKSFAEAVGGFGEAFAGAEDEAEVEVGLVNAAFAAGDCSAVDFFGFDEATLFCQQAAKENAEVCVIGSRCDSPSMPFGCLLKVASLAEQMPHL